MGALATLALSVGVAGVLGPLLAMAAWAAAISFEALLADTRAPFTSRRDRQGALARARGTDGATAIIGAYERSADC